MCTMDFWKRNRMRILFLLPHGGEPGILWPTEHLTAVRKHLRCTLRNGWQKIPYGETRCTLRCTVEAKVHRTELRTEC